MQYWSGVALTSLIFAVLVWSCSLIEIINFTYGIDKLYDGEHNVKAIEDFAKEVFSSRDYGWVYAKFTSCKNGQNRSLK